MLNNTNAQYVKPLTPMQEGVLFNSINEMQTSMVEQIHFHLSGLVKTSMFEQSWNALIQRYDILRTIFVYQNTPKPLQIVLKEQSIQVQYKDLRPLFMEQQGSECLKVEESDRSTPFNLSKDPLIRIHLLQLEDYSHYFILSYHPIILDKHSVEVLLKDFFTIHKALLQEQNPDLSIVSSNHPYMTWLTKQSRVLANEYWENYLKGFRHQTWLPQKATDSSTKKGPLTLQKFEFALNETLSSKLYALAAEKGISLSTIFTAIWGMVLGQYCESNDVVFGTLISTRTPEVDHVDTMVGLFINTIPLRVQIDSKQNFIELLQNLQKEELQRQKFYHTSLVDIQKVTPLKQGLFDHVLVFEEESLLKHTPRSFGGPFSINPVEANKACEYHFVVQVFPEDLLRVVIRYETSCYDSAFVERLETHLNLVMKAILSNETVALEGLSVFPQNSNLTDFHLGLTNMDFREEDMKHSTTYVAPRNDSEENLAALWKEALKLDKIGIDDNFFEVGGDSLDGSHIISRVYQSYGIKIGLTEFFENPSIRTLAELIENKNPTHFTDIEVLPQKMYYDISLAQQRVWNLVREGDDPTPCNRLTAVLLEGVLEIPIFKRTLETLCQRHESLRTAMITIEGVPKQVILEKTDYPLTLLDFSDELLPHKKVTEFIQQEGIRYFNLATGPLFRVALIKLKADKYVYVLNMHQIIGDAWSMGIFNKEMATLYNAKVVGEKNPLIPLKMQHIDFAVWQKEELVSDWVKESSAYWHQKLEGASSRAELPTDFPRPEVMTYRGEKLQFELDSIVSQQFKKLCRANQASLFMGLLTAVKILLYRYTGQEDTIVGASVSGRNHQDFEDQIGFYANTLVLRDRLQNKQSFLEILKMVKHTTIEAFDHQDYPIELLIEKASLSKKGGRAPLFDVMLIMQSPDFDKLQFQGVKSTPFASVSANDPYDLTINFIESESGLRAEFKYRVCLFKPAKIQRLWWHLESIINGVIGGPQQDIGRLGLLLGEEEAQYNEIPKPQAVAYSDVLLY